MVENPSTGSTLPALDTQLSGAGDSPGFVLTLLFHPDASRVGESCVLALEREQPGLSLGRSHPRFSFRLRPGNAVPRPLEDPFISRDALHLSLTDAGLLLGKPAGSSRCRLVDGELTDQRLFGPEELDRGIPLLLGHGVVLLLRRCQLYRGAAVAPATLGFVGDSDAMAMLAGQVQQLAAASVDVLVRGPTGCGKERVAAALHACSPRAGGPFVPVNMAAIPADLAPAALFGAARGAYTGANTARAGFFQQASGGTLFLDEVGDTPAVVQPQLLRALQERQIQVVGGPLQAVDLRVISATEMDLDAQSAGFRAALRYRLGVGEITVPALAQHPEDIGALAQHFYRQAAARATNSADVPAMADELVSVARWAELVHLLAGYAWPGNVRELANLMARIAVGSAAGLRVPGSVLEQLRSGRVAAATAAPGAPAAGQEPADARQLSDAELAQALEAGQFEVARVARQLGMSRQALYRRIDASGHLRLAGDVPLQELLKTLEACRGDLGATAESLRVSRAGLRTRLRAAGIEPRASRPD